MRLNRKVLIIILLIALSTLAGLYFTRSNQNNSTARNPQKNDQQQTNAVEPKTPRDITANIDAYLNKEVFVAGQLSSDQRQNYYIVDSVGDKKVAIKLDFSGSNINPMEYPKPPSKEDADKPSVKKEEVYKLSEVRVKGQLVRTGKPETPVIKVTSLEQ